MKQKECKKPHQSGLEEKALQNSPGAAIDAADSDKVTSKAVKERTEVLGNNPRNND